MCETVTSHRTTAGEARHEELTRWVAADLAANDLRLTHSLRQWRDEFVRRILPLRPQVCRIPWVFVDQLELASQRVVLQKDGSVHEYLGRNKGQIVIGTLIVPAAV